MTDEFRPSEIKKVEAIIDSLNSAKSADEIWNIRKAYDQAFSEAVKNATSTSAPSTRKAYQIWMEGRGILNE